RPVLEVACEESDLNPAELARLLDPTALTEGGIHVLGEMVDKICCWRLCVITLADADVASNNRPN
ncbi:hypothetical protein C5H21_12220, partial [Xylella fastidiosa]